MRDKREARARFLLGQLLAGIYKDECAAELLRDAISYMPEMETAHIELGFVYCRLKRYEEMLGAFCEAIQFDEGAVRATVRDEPAELEAIRRVLYPERPTPAPAGEARATAIPGYVRETWVLVDRAREHVRAGRDEEAVAALEVVLRLDATYQYAAALLSLAYLLIRNGGGMAMTGGEGSVLWDVEPALAELLFEGREDHQPISH
jgi:tetratricopeptide (TPR) repeat protein